MFPMLRHGAVTSAAIGLAVALAACGGGARTVARTTGPAPPTTATQPGTSTSGTSGTTGPSGATTTQTTTTSTTGGAATPPCTAADLTPSFLGSNGAAGHIVLGFALRNRSAGTCHTYGFPGIAFLDAGGAVVSTSVARSTNDFAGPVPKVGIELSPGAQASFRIVTSDVSSGAGSCPTVAGVQIIAPDDTATMRVSLSSPVLDCGKPTVSPLQPGTKAFPVG